jgi:hypothetical protein
MDDLVRSSCVTLAEMVGTAVAAAGQTLVLCLQDQESKALVEGSDEWLEETLGPGKLDEIIAAIRDDGAQPHLLLLAHCCTSTAPLTRAGAGLCVVDDAVSASACDLLALPLQADAQRLLESGFWPPQVSRST